MAADARGNVWVCDEDRGGLLVLRDPTRNGTQAHRRRIGSAAVCGGPVQRVQR